MTYLIAQMLLCLIAAAFLGFILGWSWRGALENRNVANEATAPDVIVSGEYPIEEVQGVGEKIGEKMRALGLVTTEDLLTKCKEDQLLRKAVLDSTGIADFVLEKWIVMCELMRVKGIDGQYAELLEAAKIDSVQTLSMQNAEALWGAIKRTNEEKKVSPTLPTQSDLSLWITSAKGMPKFL